MEEAKLKLQKEKTAISRNIVHHQNNIIQSVKEKYILEQKLKELEKVLEKIPK